jgi:hypothetical protein
MTQVLFFIITANVRGYKIVADYVAAKVSPEQTLNASDDLGKPLKPLCFIAVVGGSCFLSI